MPTGLSYACKNGLRSGSTTLGATSAGSRCGARARTRKFIAEYPTSRYLPLVQGVTGIHPRPSPSQMRDARFLKR